MPDIKVPVLIVGGGPVGLVLAMELGSRGVECLLVNERETTTTHPKGSTINARSMEHLRRLGAAPAVRKTGVPADHPTDIVYVTRFAGYELGRLPMPSLNEKIANPGPWGDTLLTPEPIHRSNQMYFEVAFRDHAATYSSVDMRYGWRLNSFTQYDDRVEAEIEEIGSGRKQNVTCDFLAGCDGANSNVRRALGFKYKGRDSSGTSFYDGRMMSIFVRAPEVYDIIDYPIAWHYLTINDDGRTDCITLDGKGDFLILAEAPADVPWEDIDPLKVFLTAVGKDIEAEVISAQEWIAGLAMVTDGYQKGRVYLAGDSVHLFTPSGGFGFNTGIDDAVNLGWKLAAVCKGWGGRGLLDNYEIERRPIGIRNTNESGALAEMIAQLRWPDNLEDPGELGAAAREKFRDNLWQFKEEYGSLGIQLGARYDASPLIVGDGAVPPPDEPKIYRPSSVPGGRAPHWWGGEKQSLFDMLGKEFTLLRLGRSPSEGSGIVRAAAERGIPLKVVSIPDDGIRALYERDLALIRPDQHVAWRGDFEPDDPGGLLDRVTGRL